MADSVAIVGAGAVGTMLAGYLAEAGHPVTICGRTRLDSVSITDDQGARSYPVSWAEAPADLPPFRWLVLATKLQHTAATAHWLNALAERGSVLLAAQNGVDHRDRLGPLTEAEVVPTLVYLNVERIGPGRVRARATGRGLVMPADGVGQAAAALFTGASVPVENQSDFVTVAWAKLLINVTANPLTALTGRRVEVLHEPGIADLAREMLRETVAVARAEGAALTEEDADATLDWLRSLPPTAPTSMLQDRQAGRTLEHDGLIGPVVRLGARHGIPTPTGRTLLALLDALQARRVAS